MEGYIISTEENFCNKIILYDSYEKNYGIIIKF